MNLPCIQTKILDEHMHSQLRAVATQGSAGHELHTCIDAPMTLEPADARLVPTGLATHISDPGFCSMILPRSGSRHKRGLVLGNLGGRIDSDGFGSTGAS